MVTLEKLVTRKERKAPEILVLHRWRLLVHKHRRGNLGDAWKTLDHRITKLDRRRDDERRKLRTLRHGRGIGSNLGPPVLKAPAEVGALNDVTRKVLELPDQVVRVDNRILNLENKRIRKAKRVRYKKWKE